MVNMFRDCSVFRFALACLLTLFSNSAFATPKPAEPPNEAVGNPLSLDYNEKGVAAVGAKNFSAAEDLFRKALAADPKNTTAMFNLAGVLLTNKKEETAVALLKDYLTQFDKDPGLYARLGDAYFATKKVPESAAAYEKALSTDPEYPGAHAKLATIYGLLNRLEDSERMLLRAVELNPKDGQSLNNLSAVFLANGKPDKAVSTAKRALQVKASSEIYVTLGSAYESLKDYKNSMIAYQRAIDLGDKRDELKKKVAGLKEVVS